MRVRAFLAQAVWTLAAFGMTAGAARACETPVSVCETARPSSFALIRDGRPAAVYVDAKADPAVRHAAEALTGDLALVAGGARPEPINDLSRATGAAVVVGVLGASPVIDGLVRAGKLNVGDLPGQWEGFRQVVVERPTPKLARALVIVGSDRRGAAYGAYDLSERIGVSPWAWWADAPVTRKADLFVTAGARADHPRVRYRGFFINDEDPAFSGWAKRKFGGVNADAYAHVFDLLLRLKGNYLWPAMWAPKAFNDDDPRSKIIADQMGVVMGSSHHEPMTRAQDEWHRHTDQGVTGGKWDYTTNAENLRTFWRGGIQRMMSKGDGTPYESVVTVGMRGDGDEPMSEGAATDLLERVVADQREIIADVTGKPAGQTPQIWALYKEVQDYYDHGMRVPDDVTLLFADDNWGQIRRLPVVGKDKLPRAGGYGVYYHFDYVGGPRNYKWINTNQIAKVWQQMDLAYRRGARNLWIVNVGDIKPMEYPLSFFLRQAWNPEAMTPDALAAFPRQWAGETLGGELGPEVGEILETYGILASRKKPELLDQDSFPLGPDGGAALDGGAFGAIVDRWRSLADKVVAVRTKLSPDQRDAYFQLVEYPVLALANLYEMYYATAWNRRLSARNDPRANVFADAVERAFKRDAELTAQYHALNGGKWAGMMNQVHMSYVIWNDPTAQTMPSVTRVAADTPTDRLAAKAIFTRASSPQPGLVSLEAASFERAVGGKELGWRAIPNLGEGAAMITTPQGRPSTTPADGVRLEYALQVDRAGPARVRLRLAPTLDNTGGKGLKVGVSIDDGPVQTLTLALVPTPGAASTPEQAAWVEAVKDHGRTLETAVSSLSIGRHALKVWRLDDNVVLERVEVDTR